MALLKDNPAIDLDDADLNVLIDQVMLPADNQEKLYWMGLHGSLLKDNSAVDADDADLNVLIDQGILAQQQSVILSGICAGIE